MKGEQITFEEAVRILEDKGKVIVEDGDSRYVATIDAFFKLHTVFNANFYEYI